jgi:hypothetical protein
MSETTDRVAGAWLDAYVRLARVTPKGWHAEASGRPIPAGLAYLHTSSDGRRLYESMGFRHIETWAAFSA